jgi:hypothetical protein
MQRKQAMDGVRIVLSCVMLGEGARKLRNHREFYGVRVLKSCK